MHHDPLFSLIHSLDSPAALPGRTKHHLHPSLRSENDEAGLPSSLPNHSRLSPPPCLCRTRVQISHNVDGGESRLLRSEFLLEVSPEGAVFSYLSIVRLLPLLCRKTRLFAHVVVLFNI